LGDLSHTDAFKVLNSRLTGTSPAGQAGIDARLRQLDARHGLGADMTLALSLAYARAAAALTGQSLHSWLADLAGLRPGLPRLLVNLFSGGIHHGSVADSFQQLMVTPRTASLVGDINAAIAIYAAAEGAAADQHSDPAISASSGLLLRDRDVEWRLRTASDSCGNSCSAATLGIDVAAEHLADGSEYRFEGRRYSSAGFAALLSRMARTYAIEYIEDPFDPADVAGWQAFLPVARDAGITVAGDDLFATDAARVRPGLADAVMLKPSQAGTLTATLAAARAARKNGLKLVVSHRSGETEDTSMCDLAVAVGAEWIKVGGPRRGDRTSKYNQLIRLAECGTRAEREK
jgi:enolase